MPIRDLFCIFALCFLLLLTLLGEKEDRWNDVDDSDKRIRKGWLTRKSLVSDETKEEKVVARRWKTRIFFLFHFSCSHNYSNTQRNVVKDFPLKCVCMCYLPCHQYLLRDEGNDWVFFWRLSSERKVILPRRFKCQVCNKCSWHVLNKHCENVCNQWHFRLKALLDEQEAN